MKTILNSSFCWSLLTLLFSAGGLPIASMSAQAEEMDREMLYRYVKPAVVRICTGFDGTLSMKDGTPLEDLSSTIFCGSGFIVNPQGDIVTNAHVVELAKQDNEDLDDVERRAIKLYAERIAREFDLDPRDVAKNLNVSIKPNSHYQGVLLPACAESNPSAQGPLPFTVKKMGQPLNGESMGLDIAIIKIEPQGQPPSLLLGDSNAIKDGGSEIIAVGYPGAADIPNCNSIFTASFDLGTVSPYKKDDQGNTILPLSVNISGGNSGGPIVNNQGEVVGIAVAGFTEAQGRALAVPASKIREYLDSMSVKNEVGFTQTEYLEGLQLMEKRCFGQAITQFEKVKGLFPQHSDADKFRQESLSSQEKGEGALICGMIPPVGNGKVFLYGLFGIVGLGGVATLIILQIRNSGRYGL